MAIIKICIICNKKFKTFPSDYKRKGFVGKYCSQKCMGIGMLKYDGDKKCSICKGIFNRTKEFFYNNKSKNDKLTTECKECLKKKTLARTKERSKFIENHGNKCNSCNIYNINPTFFDIDHVIPIQVTNEKRNKINISNSQVLCPNCHRLKTIKDKEKYGKDKNINI